MFKAILDHPTPACNPENHRCENCHHWQHDATNPVHATVAGSRVLVAQCSGQDEDDAAPYADLDNGAEAFVFTPSLGRCKAFTMRPDFADDDAAIEADYAHMIDQGRRETWAGV